MTVIPALGILLLIMAIGGLFRSGTWLMIRLTKRSASIRSDTVNYRR